MAAESGDGLLSILVDRTRPLYGVLPAYSVVDQRSWMPLQSKMSNGVTPEDKERQEKAREQIRTCPVAISTPNYLYCSQRILHHSLKQFTFSSTLISTY